MNTERKLILEKIANWQEAYMDKLNKTYSRILADKKSYPSDKFWKLEKRINKDKKSPLVVFRTDDDYLFAPMIAKFIKLGIAKEEEISDFSEDFQNEIRGHL